MEKAVPFPVVFLSLELIQILPMGVCSPGAGTPLSVLWEHWSSKLCHDSQDKSDTVGMPALSQCGCEGLAPHCCSCHLHLCESLWQNQSWAESRAMVPKDLACTSQRCGKIPYCLAGWYRTHLPLFSHPASPVCLIEASLGQAFIFYLPFALCLQQSAPSVLIWDAQNPLEFSSVAV